uniref:Uncharacterized protein n=1 Tax=Zea mays TaxID=4577 RepID=A0A804UFI2_MAIZE
MPPRQRPPAPGRFAVMLAQRSTPRARRRRLQASARTAAATLRDARTSFQQDDSVWTPELRFGVLKANRR